MKSTCHNSEVNAFKVRACFVDIIELVQRLYNIDTYCYNSLSYVKILHSSHLKAIIAESTKNCDSKINIRFKNVPGLNMLPTLSPFPTMFSKGSYHRVVKSLNCVVMG